MSDVQWLFAVLGALYVWECLPWLRRNSMAFCTWTGRHWFALRPSTMFGNAKGGFILVNPLPPLGTFFVSNHLPVSLGPAGVLWFASTTASPGWGPLQRPRFMTWDQTATIQRRGKRILLGEERLWTAPTISQAEHLILALHRIAASSPTARDAAIHSYLNEMFDSQQLQSRLSTVAARTHWMRVLLNLAFVLLFLAAPLGVTLIGLKIIWLWLVVVWLLLAVTVAMLFARAHRFYYPNNSDERFTQTLMIALAPATTLRAHDILTRHLVENHHPLTIAKELLPAASFQRFSRRTLIDLRHAPQRTDSDSVSLAMAIEVFFRQAQLMIVERWLQSQNVDLKQLCRAPERAEEDCAAYCPRCEAQFTAAQTHCADCGGLALVPFPNAS